MKENFQTSLIRGIDKVENVSTISIAVIVFLMTVVIVFVIYQRRREIQLSSYINVMVILSIVFTACIYGMLFHRSVTLSGHFDYMNMFYLFFVFGIALFVPLLLSKVVFERVIRGSYKDNIEDDSYIVGSKKYWNGQPITNPDFFKMPEKSLFTNIHVVGGIGSGKTTTISYPILQQILFDKRKRKKPAVFIPDIKGSIVEDILLWDHPRKDDIVILGFGYEQVNLLDSDDPLLAANNIITGFSGFKRDNDNDFYRNYQETFLRNTMVLLFEFAKRDRKFDIEVLQAPKMLDDLWKEHSRLEKTTSPQEQQGKADKIKKLRKAIDHWTLKKDLSKTKIFKAEIITLEEVYEYLTDANTRAAVISHTRDYIGHVGKASDERKHIQLLQSSVDYYKSTEDSKKVGDYLTGLTNDISTLLTDKIKKYFTASVKFDFTKAIHDGKIIVINVPEGQFGTLSKLIALQFLLQYQKAVLKRMDPFFNIIDNGKIVPYNNERLCFIILDEVQKFMCAELANFSSVSRQAKACTVALHQDLGQIPEEYQTSFLANFRTKIVLNVNDNYTSEYYSKFFGEHITKRVTNSKSKGNTGGGRGRSITDQREPRFYPQDIIQLKKNRAVISFYDGDQVQDSRIIELLPYYLPQYNLYRRILPDAPGVSSSPDTTGADNDRIQFLTDRITATKNSVPAYYSERAFMYGNLGNLQKCLADLDSCAAIYMRNLDLNNFIKIKARIRKIKKIVG